MSRSDFEKPVLSREEAAKVELLPQEDFPDGWIFPVRDARTLRDDPIEIQIAPSPTGGTKRRRPRRRVSRATHLSGKS